MSQTAAIISATAAMFALIFAIFGASWLNQRSIQNVLGLNQSNLQTLLGLNQRALENLIALNQHSTENQLALNQRSTENLLEQHRLSTEKLLEEMVKHFDARFDTLISEIRRLDQRIDALEQRFSERIIH